MPLVGKDTEMTSPPVKYGVSFCRSGDIISMRHTRLAKGGTVRSCSVSRKSMASSAQLADQPGLRARLDVQRLDVLQRRAPVLSEAELLGGAQHLAVAPLELGLGDLDQLLGAVGDPLALELGPKRVAADRVAQDRVAVALVDSGDLLAQVLGVAAQLAVELAVGLPAPPAEDRVVAVVVAEPARERALQVADPDRRPGWQRAGRP